MPDGSVSFTTPRAGVAPITITALGHHLAALREREHKLDCLRLKSAGRHANPHRTRCAERAWDAIYEQVLAVEELILESQASTVEDAAVQAMIANARLARIKETEVNQDELDKAAIMAQLAVVERALWSVTKASARAASLDLGDVAGDTYAPLHLDPAPDLDLSGVVADDRAEYPACDCPLPAVEVR